MEAPEQRSPPKAGFFASTSNYRSSSFVESASNICMIIGITHANAHLKSMSANLSCISSRFRNTGNGSVAAPTKKKTSEVPGRLLKLLQTTKTMSNDFK